MLKRQAATRIHITLNWYQISHCSLMPMNVRNKNTITYFYANPIFITNIKSPFYPKFRKAINKSFVRFLRYSIVKVMNSNLQFARWIIVGDILSFTWLRKFSRISNINFVHLWTCPEILFTAQRDYKNWDVYNTA